MAINTPKYRKQKRATGDTAFVELNGQKFYLGEYDSSESKEKYHHLLSEWTAAGEQLPAKADAISLIVVESIA